MLADDPSNTMVMFGLAKEYEKLGEHAEVIKLLEQYLQNGDDEGNAYGVLANAYAHARTLRLADGPDEVHRNQIGRLELKRWN